MRGAWLRPLSNLLVRLYGDDAKNASYRLQILADVLQGVPKHLAGAYCTRCGSKLSDGLEMGIHADGDPFGDVMERVCIGCYAEGRALDKEEWEGR